MVFNGGLGSYVVLKNFLRRIGVVCGGEVEKVATICGFLVEEFAVGGEIIGIVLRNAFFFFDLFTFFKFL